MRFVHGIEEGVKVEQSKQRMMESPEFDAGMSPTTKPASVPSSTTVIPIH